MATNNFFYKNRCVAISDADYEDGNLPECENDFFGRNKMLLQKVLMYDITINIGYYSGGCIDYSINDSYEDIITDYYGYYYTPCSKKELINDICYYCKDTMEISKSSLQRLLKGFSMSKDFDAILGKIEDYILPKIESKVNEIINDIKRKYGYIELTRVSTLSNGEAIYKKIG